MKVLLPLRDGGDNAELMYALRSWEKYLMIDVELIVVGNIIPTWLKPDGLIEGNLHAAGPANVYDNIRRGCEALSGESEIIIMNDDFFVLDPVRDIIPTYRSSLAEHIGKARGMAWWLESLRTTMRYLNEVGITDPVSYELHRPCVVDPSEMATTLTAAADYSPDNPPQWRTLYGNLSLHWKGAAQARDAKSIRTTQIPIGIPFVSTDDVKWRQYWGRVISPLFPDKSRWEATT